MTLPALESAIIASLQREAGWYRDHMPQLQQKAGEWVGSIRQQGQSGLASALLAEYGLSSEEGLLLMCLAEALLRIPDAATADALILDKLSPGHWEAHIGLGRPWFVSLAGYGLGAAGRIADEKRLGESVGAFLARLTHRLGEPVVRRALRQAMRLLGEVFVLGEDMGAAQREAKYWRRRGYRFSFDMLGEGARTATQAEQYRQRYHAALESLAGQPEEKLFARDGISVKLSALHPRFELRQWERLEQELLPHLESLALKAMQHHLPLTIDAEEATRLDVTLQVFAALRRLPSLARYAGLGLAVQAYQTHALETLTRLKNLAEETGHRLPVRLVKGAYWDAEIKRAQMEGLAAYPVFTRKAHTDVSYLACAEYLLTHPEAFYPQFATHNALTIAAVLERAQGMEYEFQRLHGMGEEIYETVRAENDVPCRIYAPVGPGRELLSYLLRRILENGANSSFVHNLADAKTDTQALLADPFAASGESTLPLPSGLYLPRKNSLGADLGDAETLTHWQSVLSHAAPVPDAPDPVAVGEAYSRAKKAFIPWSSTSVEHRAALLEACADAMEAQREPLALLCMQEAGRTLADALAEVREAVDFCRYYAAEARRLSVPVALPGPTGERNILTLHPCGVMVAISPWNFPLAIFTGQVAAALVTGNCVLAKPAEQTPRMAALVVELMHQTGVPKGVLQCVPGDPSIGAALVAHPDCAGVVFTGSTTTAKRIQRILAEKDGPIVPLIAETGGQNCMVVDSSALLEQTVDDIIASAFLSAGQRCSALRVAFVQEDIADTLYGLLAGAMQELCVGDPLNITTDIGPVIDEVAAARLRTHLERMKKEATLIAATPLKVSGERFIAPHAFEIPHIGLLKEEVFGPILHLVRYRSTTLHEVIAQINSTGYGLTFGMQSRVDATIHLLCERVQAGNIYINRPMTGAVVGLQPFGGMGLSGTGPKAGGPNYLLRFCHECTLTTNTAAIGGNIELLARKE